MSNRRVGVIDVGSNTIKLLVAERSGAADVHSVHFDVDETRIGEGIGEESPRILTEDVERGAQAIQRLVHVAKRYEVDSLRAVATSAVRDAGNRDEFCRRVLELSGCALEVLSGLEEAHFIGAGLQTDPNLQELPSFTLLDMGGGSLECIHFLEGRATLARSLNLGAVRLASRFVSDRKEPLYAASDKAIQSHVRGVFEDAAIAAGSAPSPIAVLTGGTAAILAASHTEHTPDQGLSRDHLVAFHLKIANAHFDERTRDHGIPESRADIFPAATSALCAALEYLGCERVRFSRRNLRFGIADALLRDLESTP